jgi:single-strand DNA-binding protein
MSSLNKVQLIGNLGCDPETSYMPNRECVTRFSLATSEKWIDKQSGEKKEKTEWHNITAFRKVAEICGQYLKKGSSIYCEGKLQTQKYTDKDGIEKYATKIIIDAMQMLGGRSDDQAKGDAPSPQAKSNPPAQPQPEAQTVIDDLDDDIPF